MVTSQSSAPAATLSALLTSLQQGVQAINNISQTMGSIFPSS